MTSDSTRRAALDDARERDRSSVQRIELDARSARQSHIALRVAIVVLVGAALYIAAPYWPPLVLAGWFAGMTRPALERLSGALGGRSRAAALLTLTLFIGIAAPVLSLGVAIVLEAIELGRTLMASSTGREALESLVREDAEGGPAALSLSSIPGMIEQYASGALRLVGGVAGVAANMGLGLLVFFSAAYALLVDGPRAYAWMARNTPIANAHLARFEAAYQETGRGLAVSVGLTGLAQAALATIAYLALGVPRALVLGLATLLASVIPFVGTALVWVPVAIALTVSGRTTEGIVLAVVGTVVISGSDNLLRPLFAKWGRLDMHSLVVLVSMLGALAVVGPWGIVLGPLVVRLAIEALRLSREEAHDQ